MSTNLARNLLNKYLLRYKNQNFSQLRLESYKAAIIRETDKPLVIDSVKVKKLEKNQIRIQVHYCSVNSNDCAAFKDTALKVPYVPGYELSGEVLEVGSEVTAAVATVGENVAVLSRHKGGFAQQCVVDKTDVWRLPGKVSSKSAAVMINGHSNALYAFSRLANLNEKSTVLISAGPAGLGLAAVDVAANVFKVKPVGVCDNADQAELIRNRGAFATTTYDSKNVLKDLRMKKGVDVVYDAIGGENHHILSSCVKTEGMVFYAAPLTSEMLLKPRTNSWWMSIDIENLRDTNPELYREIVNDTLDIADQGLIKAHVSASYSLEEINNAIKYIEDKKCTGKVVIKVLDD